MPLYYVGDFFPLFGKEDDVAQAVSPVGCSEIDLMLWVDMTISGNVDPIWDAFESRLDLVFWLSQLKMLIMLPDPYVA